MCVCLCVCVCVWCVCVCANIYLCTSLFAPRQSIVRILEVTQTALVSVVTDVVLIVGGFGVVGELCNSELMCFFENKR